jgi:hypothetical protein
MRIVPFMEKEHTRAGLAGKQLSDLDLSLGKGGGLAQIGRG